MSTVLKPLYDKVVIRPTNQETTKSGLYIPSQNSETNGGVGIIESVNTEYIDIHGNVIKSQSSVGDIVLYNKYNSSEVKVDGQKYFICNERDILAILETKE